MTNSSVLQSCPSSSKAPFKTLSLLKFHPCSTNISNLQVPPRFSIIKQWQYPLWQILLFSNLVPAPPRSLLKLFLFSNFVHAWPTFPISKPQVNPGFPFYPPILSMLLKDYKPSHHIPPISSPLQEPSLLQHPLSPPIPWPWPEPSCPNISSSSFLVLTDPANRSCTPRTNIASMPTWPSSILHWS